MHKRILCAAIAAALSAFPFAARAVVNTTISAVSYACNGATSQFAIPYAYPSQTAFEVTRTSGDGSTTTTLALGTDYSISPTSTSVGGTTTLIPGASKCAAGSVLRISRAVPYKQTLALSTQGPPSPKALEGALDSLEMQLQQIDAKIIQTDFKSYVDQVVNSTLTGGTVVQPLTWGLTGDGAAAVFSIPNAVVSSPDLYSVTIDGLVQRPTTDYTVNSLLATISFTSPPAYNAAIVVRSLGYARALSVGDNTQVLPNGATVPMALRDSLASPVNARAFGADPTGATNSTSAIQAAANAGANTVYLPPGVYTLTANGLNLPSNVRLVGAGKEATTIKITGAGDVVRMLNTSNTGLYNLTVDIGLNAAAVGLHIQATGTSAAFRNNVSGVRFYSAASPTVAGQIGIYVETSGSPNGAWFNDFDKIHIQGIARPIVLSAIANQNRFSSVGIEQFGPPASTGYGVESIGDNNVFSGFTFSKGGSSSTTLYGFRFGPTTGGYNVVTASTADIGTVGSIGKFEAGAGVLNNVIIGSDSSSGSSATYDAAASASNIAWPGPGGALSVPKVRPQNGNLTLDAAGGSVISTAGLNITTGSLFIGTGRGITFIERVTGTYDPPSLATGVQTTNVQGITGVNMGDHCTPSFSLDLQGMQLTAYVSSTNNVTVVLRNGTAGTLDLASGTLKVLCMRTN